MHVCVCDGWSDGLNYSTSEHETHTHTHTHTHSLSLSLVVVGTSCTRRRVSEKWWLAKLHEPTGHRVTWELTGIRFFTLLYSPRFLGPLLLLLLILRSVIHFPPSHIVFKVLAKKSLRPLSSNLFCIYSPSLARCLFSPLFISACVLTHLACLSINWTLNLLLSCYWMKETTR